MVDDYWPCYKFTMKSTLVTSVEFDRTSFQVYLDNVMLTLGNQTHSYETINDEFNTSVSFCFSFFAGNKPLLPTNSNGSSMNDIDILTIAFEEYPTDLIVKIIDIDSEAQATYYRNEFGDTVNDDNNNNNTLVLPNIDKSCFDIYIYDKNYQDIEIDSSLNHVKYTVSLNNEIIKYGGYFSSYELTSFCNSNETNYFCQYSSNECNGITIDADKDDITPSWGYKSYYNATLTAISDLNLYFYGSKSFGNGKITSAIYEADSENNCHGTLSCMKASMFVFPFAGRLDLYCQGFYSCTQVSIKGLVHLGVFKMHCLATHSCSKEMYMRFTTYFGSGTNISLAIDGSFVTLNTNSLLLDNHYYKVEISGYYSMYNSTIKCADSNSYCYIECLDDSLQLFYVENVTLSNNCNNQTTEDNVTIVFVDKMIELEELIQLATSDDEANGICSEINDSLVYDIGYPYNVDNDIINTNEKGYICCRGYRSCFGAGAVISQIGNILCLAAESCRDTVLWNTDDSSSTALSSRNNSTMKNSANIFCLANGACADSTLKSQNGIYCLTPDSCSDTVILDGLFIYCTMDACSNSKITNVESIYLFDSQSDMIIFSNNIGEMDVYLRGLSAGYDVTIYCNENDFCFIDCGTQTACNNLDLYCLGKCVVNCNETLGVTCPNMIYSRSPSAAPTNAPSNAPSQPPTFSPSAAPTNSPSNAPTVPPSPAPTDEPTYQPSEIPTANPTESSALTEEDIEISMQYVLIAVGSVVFLMILFGFIDSKWIHENELFEYGSIMVFLFYTADFISDVCFSAKLLLRASNTSFLILFIASVFFILLPICFNLYQLHNEIKSWYVTNMNDATAGAATSGVTLWITSRIKLIYILAFISGSSFSAIALLNSYLFELEVFSMGLSKQQKAAFQNKRIFSVVLLENFPQLMIQVVSLIVSALANDDGFDLSGEVVTILSLIFTLVSIGLSIAEFFLSKDLIGSKQCLSVTFEVNGKDFDEISHSKFKSNIIFKRKSFVRSLARILKIDDSAIERLKPIQTESGAIFTIIIDTFVSGRGNSEKFKKSDVNKENLCKAIAQGYKMESDIFISELKIAENVSKLTTTQSLKQLAVMVAPTKTNFDMVTTMSSIVSKENSPGHDQL